MCHTGFQYTPVLEQQPEAMRGNRREITHVRAPRAQRWRAKERLLLP
jgi:hypothetical protein